MMMYLLELANTKTKKNVVIKYKLKNKIIYNEFSKNFVLNLFTII